MKLIATTQQNIPDISAWIALDPWHEGQSPDFWLTAAPGSLLAFRLDDEDLPLLYCRLDEPENDLIRIHLQFAPEDIVPKSRLVPGLLQATPIVFDFARQHASGIIFESTSPDLIKFFAKHGFERVQQTDDYILRFAPVVELVA